MVVPKPRIFPRCPKCENSTFESQPSNFRKTSCLIVYCASCGAVIGLLNVPTEKPAKA